MPLLHSKVASTLGIRSVAVLYSNVVLVVGWRAAQRWAALVALTMAIICAVFMRHSPEPCGCLPDGAKEAPRSAGEEDSSEKEGLLSDSEPSASDAAPRPPRSYTLAEALRTTALWLFNLDNVINAMYMSGMEFHLVNMLLLRGSAIGPGSVALTIFIPRGVTDASSALLVGWLVDRGVPHKYLFAASNLAGAAAIVMAPSVDTPLQGVCFGLLWGLGSAAFTAYYSAYAMYFGREHLGKIQSTQNVTMVSGTMIGPVLLGVVSERVGYRPVLYALAVFPATMALLQLCCLRKPRQ